MNYILFDEPNVREQLLPLTFTRPVCEIRMGIMTVRGKWEFDFGKGLSHLTQEYLTAKYPLILSQNEDNVWINGSVLPNAELLKAIKRLKVNEMIACGKTLIAKNSGKRGDMSGKYRTIDWDKRKLLTIECLWDIFVKNGTALEQDFKRLSHGKRQSAVSSTNILLGKNIFIENGAQLECAVINARTGPVYIEKDCEIMEGAIIKGPVAICRGAIIKAGAKIYGPTTIGPYCKVGGEVNNSVIFGNSNKGHDGFLGNAVVGEWCNLGADTNNSNLKNNYSEVNMWNYPKQKEVPTGLIFCGLIMGDHSKCGINTMFNTGTVVGVSANIFGMGFPPKFIPSFSWGGVNGFASYRLSEAIATASRMYERRNRIFTSEEQKIFAHIFSLTKGERKVNK